MKIYKYLYLGNSNVKPIHKANVVAECPDGKELNSDPILNHTNPYISWLNNISGRTLAIMTLIISTNIPLTAITLKRYNIFSESIGFCWR
jgi:hypothetical protein